MTSWNTDNSGASGYDDDDRLVYWKHADSSQTQSWNLSLVGDWNSTTINGTQQNRTHNNVHELTAVDSTPLTYDVKGNLTTNTSGHTYSWDFDNRLSGSDTDGNSVDDVFYEYDALGRRVRKNNGTTNTVYVLSGWQVIAEYASVAAPASPSEQYVYASYIDEPILKTGTGATVYYSRNRQYSITALTNSTGSAVERYAYDSHGKLVIFNASGSPIAASQFANAYTYTGRQLEPEANLYYFRARYFDSALGRFIGRDPLGFVDGLSKYRSYLALVQVDPLGLCVCDQNDYENRVLRIWNYPINSSKPFGYKMKSNRRPIGFEEMWEILQLRHPQLRAHEPIPGNLGFFEWTAYYVFGVETPKTTARQSVDRGCFGITAVFLGRNLRLSEDPGNDLEHCFWKLADAKRYLDSGELAKTCGDLGQEIIGYSWPKPDIPPGRGPNGEVEWTEESPPLRGANGTDWGYYDRFLDLFFHASAGQSVPGATPLISNQNGFPSLNHESVYCVVCGGDDAEYR